MRSALRAPVRSRKWRRLGAIAVGFAACAVVTGATAWDDSRHVPDADSARERLVLAVAYEHGEGVPKDLPMAAALYCEAARAGNPDAQFGLGWMYANGRGVARNDDLAASLFALAAAAGHEPARQAQRFVGAAGARLPDCMRVEPPPVVTLIEDDPFAGLPPDKQRIVELVARIAPGYSIDPRLALAVIAVESDFEPRARSVKDAQGLMQLIPDTAARFNVRNPFDPLDNIKGGLAYLRWLLSYYRGQVTLALAAYNAGERAVDKHRGVPPYAETRDYVRKVRGMFRHDQHPYDPAIAVASPALGPLDAAAR